MSTPSSFAVVHGTAPAHPGPGTVRVALVQMDVAIGDVETNLERVIAGLDTAREEGAALVVFPECALTGYCFSSAEEVREAAVETGEPWLRRLSAACAERDMVAVVGYLERLGPEPEAGVANTVAVVGGTGLLGVYRKTHLPYLGADRFTEPGSNPFRVHEVLGLRVGLLICYDASFPEASRLLALGGADLILLPTNWPQEAIAKADWLPNARAYENVVYFASVNRVGTERGFRFHGRSRLCDPRGETVAQGPRDAEAVLVVDIDPVLARTKKIERREGYWVDRIEQRRPDLYRLTDPGAPPDAAAPAEPAPSAPPVDEGS